jgi:hypothetical protein
MFTEKNLVSWNKVNVRPLRGRCPIPYSHPQVSPAAIDIEALRASASGLVFFNFLFDCRCLFFYNGLLHLLKDYSWNNESSSVPDAFGKFHLVRNIGPVHQVR